MDTDWFQHDRAWPHLAGAIGAAALFIWFATWTGPGQPGALADALWVLASSLPYVVAWLAAAMGYGWLLRLALAKRAQDGLTLQLGLGVAALLWLDVVCGAAGLLQFGGSIGAWTLIAIGVVALAMQIAKLIQQRAACQRPHWLMWTAAPSFTVLLVASCSAPGVLWATEFGGYDALSYHLQLPKEWLAIGRIQPLEHNVYSFLPGYMEAAYYHLAVMRGDAIAAAYACQLLHAAMTLLAALAMARIASRLWNGMIGAVAATLVLGTPWVIVAGSLAYSEMLVLLMFVVGWSAIHDDGLSPIQRGGIAGITAAAACGAKLTAAGMVVAPLLLMILLLHPPRMWLRIFAPMFIAGVVVLAPYLARNLLHAGNPVFPFATEMFGTAHWTAEQAAIWHRGHVADANLPARLGETWNQFMRFGLGRNPYSATEPWKPQWSVLPWLGVLGLMVALALRDRRRNAIGIAVILAVQLGFWISLTHLKSRFLLPAAIPLVLGICEAFDVITRRVHSRTWLTIGVVALLAWSVQPALIFRSEVNKSPAIAIGTTNVMTGDALSQQERREYGLSTFPAVALNHLLPANSRILGIGFATPFYVRANLDYHTTWDRGLLSQLMREFSDDPMAWALELRRRGFTHLIVDRTMLDVWQAAGWNDPLITSERVDGLVRQHARPLFEYPSGIIIYEFPITENTP